MIERGLGPGKANTCQTANFLIMKTRTHRVSGLQISCRSFFFSGSNVLQNSSVGYFRLQSILGHILNCDGMLRVPDVLAFQVLTIPSVVLKAVLSEFYYIANCFMWASS